MHVTGSRADSREGTETHRSPPMLRSVGLKALWDQRTSLLWWMAGTGALSVIVVILFPFIESAEEMEALLERMPPAIQALIGEEIDIASAAGYLDLRVFTTIAPIIFLVYAVGRSNAALTGEEDRGTMDLLLSLPVPRWRIVAESSAASTFGLVAIGFALWVGLVIGALLADVAFSFDRAAQATAMGVLLGMVFAGLTLSLGALTARSGIAIGASVGFAVASYLLHSLAPLVDWLEPFRLISPFYHYIGQSPMREGINAPSAIVLAVTAIILTVLAAIAFQRRDVQV